MTNEKPTIYINRYWNGAEDTRLLREVLGKLISHRLSEAQGSPLGKEYASAIERFFKLDVFTNSTLNCSPLGLARFVISQTHCNYPLSFGLCIIGLINLFNNFLEIGPTINSCDGRATIKFSAIVLR